MSKSQFEKLFEEVINDEQSMDAGDSDALFDGSDSEGSEFGGGDEDQVTITLDKETALKLIDVLKSAVGDEEESEGEDEMVEGEDESFGDEGEDEGSPFPESVVSEAPEGYKPHAGSKDLTKKGDIKVDGELKSPATPAQDGTTKSKPTDGYMKASTSVDQGKDIKVKSNLGKSDKPAFTR